MKPFSGRFFSPMKIGLGIAGLAVLIGVACIVNGKITEWVNGDGFRAMLDKETSKGLKFQAHYAPLRRVGLLGMETDSFHGDQGARTIVSMDADQISGWFNPLGAGLRRWQVDDIHMKSGTVMLQKTDPLPGAPKGPPPIPWWALFWPYRVYLEDVKVDDAKVLFQLQEKESGIYDTFLEITPNGRDFEYDAKGGVLATPMTPKLNVEHAHLLIRKPRLYCPTFILGDDAAHPEEQIRVTGDAGLQDDRSMHLSVQVDSLQVAPWLPEKWRDHVLGHASGKFDYQSTGTGLETAEANGSVTMADAVLHTLPPVEEYIKLTSSPDPGDLRLKVCQSDMRWDKGAVTLENLRVECNGVFKLEGTVTMAKDKSLSGEVHLGLTEPYLRWLPTAKTAIFTAQDGVYFVTTIHISGTAEKPVQDLSPRVAHEIGKSPLLALQLFFKAL
jgi:hypothetical protein